MSLLDFHPSVSNDLADALVWLDQHTYSQEAGDHLVEVFQKASNEIARRPLLRPLVYREFRKEILRPFPYLLFYRMKGDTVVIVLLVHGARDPAFIRKELRVRD